MINEPKYDEDLVNFGFLKSALKNEKKEAPIQANKNFGSEPIPPYYINDTWTQGATGNMYRCVKERLIGKYNPNDWEVATGNVTNEILEEKFKIITEQIDKKIETYRTDEDPSINWVTTIEKEKHIGDMWYDTINQINKLYIKNDNEYIWAESDIPSSVYDLINSKGTIYTSKPNRYNKDDVWIIETGATNLPNNCSVGHMVIATVSNTSYNKNDWVKKDSYTNQTYVDGKAELEKENAKEEIRQEMDNHYKPTFLQQAKTEAQTLINTLNSGYVIKDEVNGVLYITDNTNINLAVKVWKWSLNGLSYSSNGVNGEFNVAITADGKIVADFITAGTLSADRIKGGVLNVGGFNSTNGIIKVLDSKGNIIINLNNKGIELQNGSKIIGDIGVISKLQVKSNEYENIGFENDMLTNYVKHKPIFLEVNIPNNFTITSAKIKVRHAPIKILDKNTVVFYGYCRNIRLYSCLSSKIDNYRKAAYVGSHFVDEYVLKDYSEIANALGSDGFTPISTSTNSNVQTKESIELKNYLRTGINRLMLKSSNSIPAEEIYEGLFNIAPLKNSGFATVYLDITGYSK